MMTTLEACCSMRSCVREDVAMTFLWINIWSSCDLLMWCCSKNQKLLLLLWLKPCCLKSIQHHLSCETTALNECSVSERKEMTFIRDTVTCRNEKWSCGLIWNEDPCPWILETVILSCGRSFWNNLILVAHKQNNCLGPPAVGVGKKQNMLCSTHIEGHKTTFLFWRLHEPAFYFALHPVLKKKNKTIKFISAPGFRSVWPVFLGYLALRTPALKWPVPTLQVVDISENCDLDIWRETEM